MNNELAVQAINPYVALRVGHQPVGNGKEANIYIKRELASVLEIAYFDMGNQAKMDAQILIVQTEALFKELNGKYSLLTLPEVKEAFRRGIRGESGPFFGLCPKTYHQFLKWFYELPDRNSAWQSHLTQLSQQTAQEKKIMLSNEQLKQACLDAFSDYKSSGKMPYVPFAIYEQIKTFKGVQSLVTDTRWKQVKVDALELFKKRQTQSMTKKKTDQYLQAFKADLADQNLINTIKEVALRTYFGELIAAGKTLEL